MLSENLKEISASLVSVGESPRVCGNGFHRRLGRRLYTSNLDDEAADFLGTEELLRAEISPARKLPLPSDQEEISNE